MPEGGELPPQEELDAIAAAEAEAEAASEAEAQAQHEEAEAEIEAVVAEEEAQPEPGPSRLPRPSRCPRTRSTGLPPFRRTRAGVATRAHSLLHRLPPACGIPQNFPLRAGNSPQVSSGAPWEPVFPYACKLPGSGPKRLSKPGRPDLSWPSPCLVSAMAQLAQASPTAPVPPQNLEAEESVLGAMMLSPGAIGAVSEVLDASDFYRESHAKIYRAALALYSRASRSTRSLSSTSSKSVASSRTPAAASASTSWPRSSRRRQCRALRAHRARDGNAPRPDPRGQRDRPIRLGPARARPPTSSTAPSRSSSTSLRRA